MCTIVVVVYGVTYAALIVLGISPYGDGVDASSRVFWTTVILFASLVVLLGAMAYLLNRMDRVFVDKNNRLKRIATATHHELRTPLTLMLANLDVLEMEHGKDELIDDMREEALHMSHLVAKMSELSRLEEGEYVFEVTDVDLSNLARACLAQFKPLFQERGLRCESSIKDGVLCKANESEMKQVLFILFDNATKYCDKDGLVEVKVSCSDRGHAELRIENTFAGVDSNEFKRFFERFYRSDEARATSLGDGLGLPLAALSAEKFGGSVKAYTVPEKNAIGFRLTLLQ